MGFFFPSVVGTERNEVRQIDDERQERRADGASEPETFILEKEGEKKGQSQRFPSPFF